MDSHGFVLSVLCTVLLTVCLIALFSLTVSAAGGGSSPDDFSIRPEIHHIFRQPDARPMKIVPFVFTCAILVPFVGLIMMLLKNGPSISFPTGPSEFLYASVFQSSLLAILFSYTLYWLSLNIFQALALSAVCGIVAVFSGTGALRLLHARKQQQALKGSNKKE